MRVHRRELLRQIGTAAAATALLPKVLESASVAADSGERLVRLNRNESAYGPSEKAKAAFREALTEVNRYPGKEVENLRAALAASHDVALENITLGCGSTGIMRLAVEVFLGPGKVLVTASPTFDFVAQAAGLVGAEVRTAPLTRDYAHDLEGILKRTDAATSLIYICNPNNPTGTLTPRADMETFLGKVPPGVGVLIDEAYHEYVAPTSAYTSWATRATAHSQLIVTRTFSKIYGLAGLRVGYAVSSAETARRLAARRLPMDVSAVGARVALAALADTAYAKRIGAANANDRQEFFNQVNARMLRPLDSQTNFVLMRTGSSGKEVAELLRSKGVMVSSGFASFEKHIRVSLGPPEDMEAFWRAWDVLMPHHPM